VSNKLYVSCGVKYDLPGDVVYQAPNVFSNVLKKGFTCPLSSIRSLVSHDLWKLANIFSLWVISKDTIRLSLITFPSSHG